MSKQRYIDTQFWDDKYIVHLDPIEKLAFIYFITNPLTNIAGIYEITLRRIAFDTGIDENMVQKILERFEKDKKIYYIEGWIIICNFPKYQKYQERGKIKDGIDKIIKSLPCIILEAIHTLPIPYTYTLNYLDLDLDLDLDSNSDTDTDTDTQHKELFNWLKSLFHSENKTYYHDGKQAAGITKIIQRLKTKEKILAIFNIYKKLIWTKDKFWKDQPLVPMTMYSLIDRIEKHRETEKKQETPTL
jgi:hypothetical protein